MTTVPSASAAYHIATECGYPCRSLLVRMMVWDPSRKRRRSSGERAIVLRRCMQAHLVCPTAAGQPSRSASFSLDATTRPALSTRWARGHSTEAIMMRFLGLASFLVCSLAPVAAGAKTPFGGDDTGFIPPDTATFKCESKVGANVAKLLGCEGKCHAKRAKGSLADDTAEDGCEG